MDFVERVFGIAPDGGSGALELTICLVLLPVPLVVSALSRRAAGVRRKPWQSGHFGRE
jgi:hypothetical protein